MGVTIHFEGKLKSSEHFNSVIEISRDFAESNNMEYEIFEEKNKSLLRIKNEKEWDYEGLARGIKIQPDLNTDPLWIEFDKEFYIQEFCKTQFAGINSHIKIIQLLRLISPYFIELLVEDEGEYWDTKNKKKLQECFDNCFYAIEDAKKENSNLSGPHRIEGNRIVDLMENE